MYEFNPLGQLVFMQSMGLSASDKHRHRRARAEGAGGADAKRQSRGVWRRFARLARQAALASPWRRAVRRHWSERLNFDAPLDGGATRTSRGTREARATSSEQSECGQAA